MTRQSRDTDDAGTGSGIQRRKSREGGGRGKRVSAGLHRPDRSCRHGLRARIYQTLPAAGRLLFFFDFWGCPAEFLPGSRVGWRLIWDTSPVSELERRLQPAELLAISSDTWTTVFGSARITTRSVVTPIPYSAVGFDALNIVDDTLNIIDTETIRNYVNWCEEFGLPDSPHDGAHRLGGWPTPLQNGWEGRPQLAFNGIECGRSEAYETPEAVELLKTKGDWQLVLQIGCDDVLGLLPRGSGCMLVMMRMQDIRDRAFDRAWAVYQCT